MPVGPEGLHFAGVPPKAAPANEAGSPHKGGNPFARREPAAAGAARSPRWGPSLAHDGARVPVPRLALPLPLPLSKGMAPASSSPGSTPGAPRACAPMPHCRGAGAKGTGAARAAGSSRRGWHEKLCLLGMFCMGHGCSARAED